jgi:RsiW-degrading membrane proteinase PrsW (M82 family)
MNGIWVLLLLILVSALPVLPLYLWISRRGFSVRPAWFLLSLLAGAVSLALAALIQILIPVSDSITLGNLIASIFIRIALTEEISRFLVLLVFFSIGHLFDTVDNTEHSEDALRARTALTGLIAGMGFAVIETALSSSADFRIALVRAISAAPLHGACGAHIGLGTITVKTGPGRSFGRILYAVIIHGMYNFMLVSPGVPVIFPLLIAITAFFSSLQHCRRPA